MKKPPLQCLCVEHGALRSRFDIPDARPRQGGLTLLLQRHMIRMALQLVNSTIPETRAYWREKCPWAEPTWR